MNQKDYLIIIRIPVKALDDADARSKTCEITEKVLPTINLPDVKIKLQRQVEGKPPQGIDLKGRVS